MVAEYPALDALRRLGELLQQLHECRRSRGPRHAHLPCSASVLHAYALPLRTRLGPDLEARKRVEAKRVADRDIRGIAPARDQHAANTRHVVPRVKRVPATAQVGLEPGGKIHRAVWRRDADVTQVAGAVACRNVHAAAERDREMRVITADAGPFLEGLPGRLRGTGVLVPKGDM